MQTTFLSALFLTALGYLLTFYGTVLGQELLFPIDSSAPQFCGAVIAAIFWVYYSYYDGLY